jgi:short-subunit dehydrogenase
MSARKIVLITGCSSGIGAALAEEFHSRGCIVYASARKIESLQSLADKGLRTLALDVTDARSIATAIQILAKEEGCLDILVNNAGFALMGPVADLSGADLTRQFETNVVAPVEILRATLAILPSFSGLVVNIGSISGLVTTPFSGAYCASKAALHALSDAMRMELRPFGIRVVTVQPGGIKSRFGDSAVLEIPESSRFAPYAESMKRRRYASQHGAMDASVFAARLVDALMCSDPPATFRLGANARLLPALKYFLPLKWLDRFFARKFGLDSTRASP